jgi:AraC-like DNA-binding protein
MEVGLCAEATGESGPDLDAMRLFWNELALAAATAGGSARMESDIGDPADCDENRGRAARVTIIVAESAEDPAEGRSGLEAVRLLINRRALLSPGAIEAQAAARQLTSFGTADLEAATSLAHSVAAVVERDGTALREAVASFAAASRAGIGERALDLLRRFIERTLPGKRAGEALSDTSGADLLRVCEKAMELSGGAAPARPGDGDTIAAVEEFVRRRFAERLSLAETARIFGLTPNYLSALFHRRIGMTFVEYATELRLTRARELLRSGKSVKEAAWAVGYGSERHFARLYRQRFGSPPVEEKRAKS